MEKVILLGIIFCCYVFVIRKIQLQKQLTNIVASFIRFAKQNNSIWKEEKLDFFQIYKRTGANELSDPECLQDDPWFKVTLGRKLCIEFNNTITLRRVLYSTVCELLQQLKHYEFFWGDNLVSQDMKAELTQIANQIERQIRIFQEPLPRENFYR